MGWGEICGGPSAATVLARRVTELEDAIRRHRDANDGPWRDCSGSCPKGCGNDRQLYSLLEN